MRLRERIIARDNFECRRCGRSDVRKEVHHVISRADWPEGKPGLNSEENLVCLCLSCHVLTHGGNPPSESYLDARQDWRDYVKALEWRI